VEPAQPPNRPRRVLSGIQPSGGLHLGNYFAMMKRMIEAQENAELYAFLVNLHALTSHPEGGRLRQLTFEAALDFLALGLDPEKSIFWVQSDVPEVIELTWYLCNVTPVSLLQLCHSYKDKVARGLSPNHGLFTYPVLMAADILLYQGEIVPVGKDQKQHIEVSRDIALKFNHEFGEVFTIPEPLIEEEVGTIPGVDGQKMSKSYNNTIEIFLSGKKLRKRCMQIVTDSAAVEDPKDPETNTVYHLYKLFATPDETAELAGRFRAGGLKYSDAKKELAAKIDAHFAPYREKREALAARPDDVFDLLALGARKAREKALPTIERVREVTGISYRK
jgi:tryptophanyl-tRNA synthetase